MPFDPRVSAPRRRPLHLSRPASRSGRRPSRDRRPATATCAILREGFMCHGRKLDGPEALVAEARRAGLDSQRFRIDLESNAILEAFGERPGGDAHVPDAARAAGLATEGSHGSNVERLTFPSLRLRSRRGTDARALGAAARTPTRVARRGDRSGRPRRPRTRAPTWRQRCSASGAWPPWSSRRCATCRVRGRGRRYGASRASGAHGACRC